MARPNHCNGGATPVFPRDVEDSLLDLKSLRGEIEKAESVADAPVQAVSVRRHWREYRDAIEQALDVRISLMQITARSHEHEISGCARPECRRYRRFDVSAEQLSRLAQKREPTRCNESAPMGA